MHLERVDSLLEIYGSIRRFTQDHGVVDEAIATRRAASPITSDAGDTPLGVLDQDVSDNVRILPRETRVAPVGPDQVELVKDRVLDPVEVDLVAFRTRLDVVPTVTSWI